MTAESVRIRANGTELHVRQQGSGEPLVLLHGFTGSANTWSEVADDLAGDYRVVAIDLIGHGGSAAPENPDRYAYDRAVDDLAAVLPEFGVDQGVWLGYSLGARLALGLAIAHPDRVSALILESATAGIDDDGERARRRASDEALANRIEKEGVEAFVAEWESLSMWASQASLAPAVRAAQRAQRLATTPVGLANSLRGMGQGAQPSLWNRLDEVRAPTLLIAGALDPKFAELAARMRRGIPDAEVHIVPDAGHAVHLERPHRFCDIVRGFLASRQQAAFAPPQEGVH